MSRAHNFNAGPAVLPLEALEEIREGFMTFGGMSILEIPIMFVDRQVGISKMSRRIILEAMWMVWALRLRRIS